MKNKKLLYCQSHELMLVLIIIPNFCFSGGEDLKNPSPWFVFIMTTLPKLHHRSYKCGGTLLNQQWIITAAHCFCTKRSAEFKGRVSKYNEKIRRPVVMLSISRNTIYVLEERKENLKGWYQKCKSTLRFILESAPKMRIACKCPRRILEK